MALLEARGTVYSNTIQPPLPQAVGYVIVVVVGLVIAFGMSLRFCFLCLSLTDITPTSDDVGHKSPKADY